jgi:putative transposase
VRYTVVERLRLLYPVTLICKVLEVSPSGYYAWKRRPESAHSRVDRRLRKDIRVIFEESRETYGTPRVHDELRDLGIRCSRKRVARLMKEDQLVPKKARRFRVTTISAPSHEKAPNILNRQFQVDAPDTAWAGDITYLWTPDGWLYLAVLLDLYSRRVISWALSTEITQDLSLAALDRAVFERNPGAGLLHHTDRGSQYTSNDYRQRLKDSGLIASMSRKGDCWDNAVAESFFATLKVELGDSFSSREAARTALIDYIEIFYNRKRRHTSLGGLTPVQAETLFEMEAAA